MQEDGVSNRIQAGRYLAFMAIGALLGVKILRRNAEHVVTLDANTMKHWLPGVGDSCFGAWVWGCAGSVVIT